MNQIDSRKGKDNFCYTYNSILPMTKQINGVTFKLQKRKKKKKSGLLFHPKSTDGATVALHQPFDNAFSMKKMKATQLLDFGLINELFQTYHTCLN